VFTFRIFKSYRDPALRTGQSSQAIVRVLQKLYEKAPVILVLDLLG